MASNPERTKAALLEAATVEFARAGLHGTTVGRIATRAGVNRERLYAYFGDLESLFSAVLGVEVDKITSAIPLTIERPEDAGEFVGKTFDYHNEHPGLGRLMLWEGLADNGAVVNELSRTEVYRDKAEQIRRAQRQGLLVSSVDAAHLLFMLIGLASWWMASPQIARMLSGGGELDVDELGRRREAAVRAAVRISQP